MKQRIGVFATLVFSGAFGSPQRVQGQPAVDLARGPTISVQIYNWAKVSRTTLQKGQAVAEEVFKGAGVELRWVECPCEARAEGMTLSLRILPKLFGSTKSMFGRDHLGFAAANEEGGELATVFYDRIESVGKGGDLASLLGLATAHELGHLLLGSKAHTDEGIMRPSWTRKDLQRRPQKGFLFTSTQAETIHGRMSRYQTTANASR
jgi:hypothetical protein